MTTKLHYTYPKQDDDHTYQLFSASDDEGHEIGFYTNKAREGKFYRVEECGSYSYQQSAGTMQFSIPWEPEKVERRLRKLWETAYGFDYDE